MSKITRLVLSMVSGLALLIIAPSAGMADTTAPSWEFCGTTGAKWTTSTAGRSGTVSVTGECTTARNSWRVDVYVNGEWWAYSQGTVSAGTHTLRTYVPTMPKPNDRRGNFTWAKITYKTGDWTNVWEEDLGYLPCTGCTS